MGKIIKLWSFDSFSNSVLLRRINKIKLLSRDRTYKYETRLYMHLCFNECMNVSLSMGVYLCLCLLNKAFGHH